MNTRKVKKVQTTIIGLVLTLCASVTQANDQEKVIYGEDDRKDLYNVTDPLWSDLADSTVALFSRSRLGLDEAAGVYRVFHTSLAEARNLCENEPFREQPVAAFCSGSLVGEDLVLTAGHCVENQSDCTNTQFAFGFGVKSEGTLPTTLPKEEVYSCKEIVRSVLDRATKADWAIIRLDRKVTNHKALKVSRESNTSVGTPLVVIGHPSGIPTKVAGGAHVRSNDQDMYFIANLDTYGGNSGSAVFNDLTGEVAGVLVRGEQDYERTAEGCTRSYHCLDSGCRGEDVSKASSFYATLQDALQSGGTEGEQEASF